MLIAQIAGRHSAVRTIWSWTKAHLAQADGLLAFRAGSDGAVIDHEPAADADVLAAYALLRYDGRNDAAMHADGRRLAAAVLADEAVPLGGGGPIPVAGKWATRTSPATVNPSYWMPDVFGAVARYSGDGRWADAGSATETLIVELTEGGRRLPPDWAQLTDGRLTPIGAPGGRHGAQYGLDAARLPMWLGTGRSDRGLRLAAAWWAESLCDDERAAALALSLTGQVKDARRHPLPLLAAAATAAAAGDVTASRRLRSRADEQARDTPTYYGGAWLALGGALLDGVLTPYQEG
jgi:endoglucanase